MIINYSFPYHFAHFLLFNILTHKRISHTLTDGRDIFENETSRQQQQLPPTYQHGKNSKLSISEHREQFYQTVRKPPSPSLDSNLERIPEYSEDIYPYATFHLKDQDKRDNLSRQQTAQGMIYESREAMHLPKKHRSMSSGGGLAGVGIMNSTGTGQRTRKKSKKFNTESEEYDSLNSDSDTVSRELDATSRTESSNCLDDTGPVNFSSKKNKQTHTHTLNNIVLFIFNQFHHLLHSIPSNRSGRASFSPGPRKERLALLQRQPQPVHHSKLVYFRNSHSDDNDQH